MHKFDIWHWGSAGLLEFKSHQSAQPMRLQSAIAH